LRQLSTESIRTSRGSSARAQARPEVGVVLERAGIISFLIDCESLYHILDVELCSAYASTSSLKEPPFRSTLVSRARFRANTSYQRCFILVSLCFLYWCWRARFRYILGFGWLAQSPKTLIVADCKNEEVRSRKVGPYPLPNPRH